jgi:hypothetical protein
VCVGVCVGVCVSVYTYVCVSVFVYINRYVCVGMYIHIRTFFKDFARRLGIFSIYVYTPVGLIGGCHIEGVGLNKV